MIAETELAGKRALLVKPQTFYNGSGECLAAVLGYYKVPPSRLIVVHDELDLEAGRLRLKQGGSDAGNRGVRSVAQTLGTPDFIRVRVGVSRPPGESESKDYLLESMSCGGARESRQLASAGGRGGGSDHRRWPGARDGTLQSAPLTASRSIKAARPPFDKHRMTNPTY